MQCRLTRRQEEGEIKDVRTERTKQGFGGDESRDGSGDEE